MLCSKPNMQTKLAKTLMDSHTGRLEVHGQASVLEVAALCKLRLPQPIAVQAAGGYRVCLIAIADLRCLQHTMYAVPPNKVQRLVMERHDSSHKS